MLWLAMTSEAFLVWVYLCYFYLVLRGDVLSATRLSVRSPCLALEITEIIIYAESYR